MDYRSLPVLNFVTGEKFRNLQGMYPVLLLSFANIKETDYETARRKICQTLSNLYSEYEFLLDSDVLGERGRRFFKSVSEDMDDTAATMALHQLSPTVWWESGFGRYDVMLEPRKAWDDGIILEFKVQEPDEEKEMADTVQEALAQIDRQRYEAILVEKGVLEEKICKYGFAFSGKTVLIGKRQVNYNI